MTIPIVHYVCDQGLLGILRLILSNIASKKHNMKQTTILSLGFHNFRTIIHFPSSYPYLRTPMVTHIDRIHSFLIQINYKTYSLIETNMYGHRYTMFNRENDYVWGQTHHLKFERSTLSFEAACPNFWRYLFP